MPEDYSTDGNSLVMNLENSRQQYNNLLIQYKQAVADYISFLNESSSYKDQFMSIKGKTYYGKGIAGDSSATTVDTCSADCAKNKTCSGATFVAGKNPVCLLRTGESELVNANNNTYAIVPKGVQLMANVKRINDALIQQNRNYSEIITKNKPFLDKESTYSRQQFDQLDTSYETLIAEKQKISELVDEHNTLEEKYSSETLETNSNYYIFILLIFLAVVFVFILIKVSVPYAVSGAGSYQQQPFY